jgi:hypothetical protein
VRGHRRIAEQLVGDVAVDLDPRLTGALHGAGGSFAAAN